MKGRAEWWVGAGVAVLILRLHVTFWMSAGAFWRDEAHSVHLATFPSLSDVVASLKYDSFPILPSLAFRLWAATPWGGTDLGMRAFGCLVGLTIVAVFWLNSRWMGVRLPLISLMLFGLSPLAIRTTDAVRPYGLGVLFLLLAFGLIWRLAAAPSRKNLALASLAALASAQCLYQNLLLLAAPCLGGMSVAASRRDWKTLLQITGVGLIAAASILPYAPALRAAQDWVVVSQTPTHVDRLLSVLVRALQSPTPTFLWLWLICVICGIALMARALGHHGTNVAGDRERILHSGVSIVVAIPSFFILLRLAAVPSQPWYYVPLMALVAVSLDSILGPLARSQRASLIGLSLLAVVTAAALPGALRECRMRQTNIDLLAATVAHQASKDDFVLVLPWYCGVTFQRYYRGEVRWSTLPPMGELRIHRYDILKDKLRSSNAIVSLLADLRATLQQGKRIWVLGELPTQTGQTELKRLRPAPSEPSGWNSWPYLRSWAYETAQTVKDLGGQIDPLPQATEAAVNPYENLPLQVIQVR